ncbi:MAG: hypothetical protein ACT4N2_09020 [Hyphomicrobium sp.]
MRPEAREAMLLKPSTKGSAMATMNFSVPDDVKDAFNEAFKDDNKSAVVTDLMRKAIDERHRQARNESFIERIRANHARCTRSYTEEEIREAREAGRP